MDYNIKKIKRGNHIKKPRILLEQTAEKGYWKHRFVEGMPFNLYRQRQLEDLQRFGVEKGIKPLVDEINKFKFMVTCGPCEGQDLGSKE